MRAGRLIGNCVVLVLMLAGCSTAAIGTAPAQDASPSPDQATLRPTPTSPVTPPGHTPTPEPSAPEPSIDPVPSLGADSIVVRDAALVTAATGSVRFELVFRSADPSDDVPEVTGRGQVSFTEPIQFRYLADAFTGIGGTAPESEIIFDDSRIHIRGRDGVPGAPETWLVLDFDLLGMGPTIRQRYLDQYGTTLFLLVPALGVTHAERAGNETINGATTTHYVGRSSPEAALALIPPAIQDLYFRNVDLRRRGLEVRGGSGQLPDVEFEAWIDADGRIVRLQYLQEVESGDIDAYIITFDFDGFGARMDLEPPKDAEILTIADLQERYRASSAPPSPPG